MTEIYGEFGIELYDKKLEEQVKKLMQLLGEAKIRHTRRDSVVFDYQTPKMTTPYINEVSDVLCEKIEPFVPVFVNFYQNHKDKCDMNIYFVIYELGEEGVSIIINHQLLNLAMALGVEIQFDGL